MGISSRILPHSGVRQRFVAVREVQVPIGTALDQCKVALQHFNLGSRWHVLPTRHLHDQCHKEELLLQFSQHVDDTRQVELAHVGFRCLVVARLLGVARIHHLCVLLYVFFLAHVSEESRNLDVNLVLQGGSGNEVHET